MVRAELLEVSQTVNTPSIVYSIDTLASAHGHKVLRIPPHHCEFSLIQLVWSKVKAYTARHNTGSHFGWSWKAPSGSTGICKPGKLAKLLFSCTASWGWNAMICRQWNRTSCLRHLWFVQLLRWFECWGRACQRVPWAQSPSLNDCGAELQNSAARQSTELRHQTDGLRTTPWTRRPHRLRQQTIRHCLTISRSSQKDILWPAMSQKDNLWPSKRPSVFQ